MAKIITGSAAPLAPGVVTPDDMRAGVIPDSDRLEGYVPSSETDGVTNISDKALDVGRYRKMLGDYVDLKNDEIDERVESNRYYHAKQWTDAELAVLEREGRPDIVYNRIAKKVNGVVGLLERLRQDPKAYARTPNHDEGANVASQCLRFILDQSQWESQLSEVVKDLSVEGIGGWELSLDQNEDGGSDPVLTRVRPETFFYDPRSVEADFSDARFMGVAKWMAKDEAIAFLPDKEAEINESIASLSNDSADAEALDPDKENLWWDRELKKLRIIEVWERKGSVWHWVVHTGLVILAEGDSPFTDTKGRSACRYIMQSANVDEKGNRYGFVRNLKGPQDEINHRRSKALHAFNTKQIIVEEGRLDPAHVETIRREAHKPDGVLYMPEGQSGKLSVQSNTDIAMANVQMLEEAKQEIENYGVNPALLGQGIDNKSGRAIALLQQAAIAELGPFIVRMRAMKLRVYNLVWEAIRKFWTSPRYVRITDDEDVAFLAINQPRMNEFGQVIGMENPIGKVTVDFVLDEGPDTITLRQDALTSITSVLSGVGAALPPPIITELSRAVLSLTDMPPAEKKRALEAFDAMKEQPPDPAKQTAIELELRNSAAKAADTEASAQLKSQKAQEVAFTNAGNKLAAQIAMTGHASMI
jgi:hypothetical protein